MGTDVTHPPVTGDFVHLHVHTTFSLLDGANQIKPLIARVKELGMTACAITDHGVMYGVIDFYEECVKQGIRPIIGVEAYMAKRSHTDRDAKVDAKSYHQLLLAETYEGYLNLIELTSKAHLDGFYYKPRIDKKLLRQHSAGLLATSGCAGSEIPRRLMNSYEDGCAALIEYLDIFGPDRFYIELQRHTNDPENLTLNALLRRLATEFSLPIIATNDVHYLTPDDAEAQDVLVCVSSGKTVNDPSRLSMLDYHIHLASPEEMSALFPDEPEILRNTVALAERCNVVIPMGENFMPIYPIPDDFVSNGRNAVKNKDRYYLRHMCEIGMKERYGVDYTCDDTRADGAILESPLNDPAIPIAERAKVRLEYELSVIEWMGYESYFLITQDFIRWAKSQNIMIGPGRGSAAGSLVGYLLSITNVDPLFHSLIFERFLNPERVSMPDIDNDIEDTRRDEVISYVRSRYGADHVAQIITFGTMAARAAVRDVGRALGVSYKDCDYIAKLIPSGPGGMTIKEAIEAIPELKQVAASNEQLQKLLTVAARLEGTNRHTSVHAAGVVVTREPLTKYVPIQRAAKDDQIIVTQYAMNQVEHIGLLKIDFLGLSNLGIIQQALRVIRKTRGVTIDLDNLALDDTASYELLARAESTGVFQLESSGMKRYLKELKPTQFEDIVAMVALYRPGPMDAIPTFIEAKHGRRKVTFLHPILEPILKDSYGVIVTQDQVLEVARKFAGFSYGQADVLRKAVGKKIKALLDEQRDKFINGAVTTNADQGVTKALAEKVWDFVEPFARYGFNRAHAVCYAMIAYQTAYLKAHYPVEFMASLLTSDINNLDRVGIEITECRQMGIEILQPDVNESFLEFGSIAYKENQEKAASAAHDRYIRFGLGAIKNVGVHPAQAIIDERITNGSFVDFGDFLSRCAFALNKKVIENLAMAGALDSLAERQHILENLDDILAFISRIAKERNSPQLGLFGEVDHAAEAKAGTMLTLLVKKAVPAPASQRLAWERELLGIYISDHPINPYLDQLPGNRVDLISLPNCDDGETVVVAGVIMTVRKILTKKNTMMAFVGIEDISGGGEVIVFPKTWAANQGILTEGSPIIVTGTISKKEGRGDAEVLESKVLADIIVVPQKNSNEPDENGNVISTDTTPGSIRDLATLTPADVLAITVPSYGDRALLTKIKDVLEQHSGGNAVVLYVPQGDSLRLMKITQKVQITEGLLGKLYHLVSSRNVRIE
jgi:DNA polymerase III subunit alpha